MTGARRVHPVRLARACRCGQRALPLLLLLLHTAGARAGPVQPDGSVRMPPLTLPFSTFASPQARAKFARRAIDPALADRGDPVVSKDAGLAAERAKVERGLAVPIARMRAMWPVTITPGTLGGVYVETILPVGGVRGINRDRVLINLHGGGFTSGARVGGQVESIPIAGVGGIAVVAVDYRQGPEHKFPAASEDVATVYRELLKRYRPENIGIFGSSAGGVLAAEAVAWIAHAGLPRPGAVAILCASASGWAGGDATYLSFSAIGEPGWEYGPKFAVSNVPYFSQADVRDPLVAPAWTPAVLARFPPTLTITATRDFAMSAAVDTDRALERVGVEHALAIWDGLPHYFYADPDLPESHEVYERVTRFLARHLGRAPPKGDR